SGVARLIGVGTPAGPGARKTAIDTLKSGLADPGKADMGRFHSLLAAYTDKHKFTIPDLAFDGKVSDAEKKAAETVIQRLEAGESSATIRAAFGTQAATM